MLRLPLFCLALLALCPVAPAAESASSSASTSSARNLENIPYVDGGTDKQRLDLYLPPDGNATRHPLLVWIHGGGWAGGSKRDCPAKGLLAHGFVVASVEYRFSQDAIFPAQIEDCKSAIRWLRAHAAEYGIDPEKVAVWGASAGGHLVALLGTTGGSKLFDKGANLEQSSRVQCVIDFFGPTDFLHYGENSENFQQTNNLVAKLIGGPIAQHQEAAKLASPLYFVSKDSAPFLIMQGDSDNLVPLQQSQVLHAALDKAGVENTLKVLPGSGHGGAAFGSPESLKLMADFVARHLHVPPLLP